MTDEKKPVSASSNPAPTPGRPSLSAPMMAGRPKPEFAEVNADTTIPWEKAETRVNNGRDKAMASEKHYHHHTVVGLAQLPPHLQSDNQHSILCPRPIPTVRHCVQSPPQACIVCKDTYCGLLAPGAMVTETWCLKGVGHPARVLHAGSGSDCSAQVDHVNEGGHVNTSKKKARYEEAHHNTKVRRCGRRCSSASDQEYDMEDGSANSKRRGERSTKGL